MYSIEDPAHIVMASGGDCRIVVDELSGLNGYGCSPYPHYAVSYSSCTSNNISVDAYAYVESYWHALHPELQSGHDKKLALSEYEWVRGRIKAYYEIQGDVDIVLGSSGTDLELVALAFASSCKRSVHNVVMGANEVGSGIENAAQGRYFSALTPLGTKVKPGNVVGAFGSVDVSYANVEIRNDNGRVRDADEVTNDFVKEIEWALSQGKRTIVHIIHRSKTGLIIPGVDAVRELLSLYGEDLYVVVDACQGRISIRVLNEYLALGACVLLTGSKFFSGPPFSGALILPARGAEWATPHVELFAGMSDFFTRAEFPKRWTWLDGHLPDTLNGGLLLRWQAAIYEMKRVFLIPNPRIEYVINSFSKAVRRMISNTPFLREVIMASDTTEDLHPINTISPFELNTIMTMEVRSAVTGSALSIDDAKVIHKALYSDISELTGSTSRIAAIPIQLGQPVKVELRPDDQWNACLRVALGSHLIAVLALMEDDMIDRRFASDMDMLSKKLEIILSNWEKLRSAEQ